MQINKKSGLKFVYTLVFSLFLVLIFISAVFASETDGTIDSTYKYAWSNNGGWINFGNAFGNIHITDSGITGYAWNEAYGWINMNPQNSGVNVSVSGVLSGSAWGENSGWIDFTGVSISCLGKFSGTATGDNIGTITFSCTNCNVVTDYRPSNCRESGGGSSSSSSSSGGLETYCGDSACNGTETCSTCPSDCGACPPVCGDSACNGTETCSNCPTDCGACPSSCGDNVCGSNETCSNCPSDCGACPSSCGDNVCSIGETCSNCPTDCGECPPFCGDNSCNGNETCLTCESDCGKCVMPPPVSCGNRICEYGEACDNCPTDCGGCGGGTTPASCGDKVCSFGEKCDNCPTDCGICPGSVPPTCKNNICDENENCENCREDCGECKPFSIIPDCGDKVCGITENCYTCKADCGECEDIQTGIPGVTIPPIMPPAVKKIVETQAGSVATKTISTVGVATSVAVTAIGSPLTIFEILTLPLRLFALLLTLFGLKKKYPPWGVVYDSVTKQPLDPAYITLKTSNGKNIATAITDIDGRYGFLTNQGVFTMAANKTNYIFPSQKLLGKTSDELYSNLYFGEPLEISRGMALIKNIPLDPKNFDWNEFAKKDKRLTKFYSKWDLVIRKFSEIFYYVGFIVAIIAFFAAPYPYNLVIIALYIILLILRMLGIKPKTFGLITEKENGNPLPFAILRVFQFESQREISHKITDKYGRYFCLVPKGKYYVKIEKKNDDETYSLVYTSKIIDASKKGIINQRFKL